MNERIREKKWTSAQIIFGREVEMAETSEGKHNADCLKNCEADWSSYRKSC